ncbi:MAG: CRTAC1 family protein, partial [Acidobacteriota bacterium]|nr:CRTAC1 family protein [Acidobacteriota bacterium]
YVARELIPTPERWYTNCATQADLDGDGHLDLIIGNYFPDGARILDATGDGREEMAESLSRSFNGGRNRLLLWAGSAGGAGADARFEEAKGVLSDEVAEGWTLAVGAADLDGDLLPEIYFANDFGPDRLLHNLSTPGHLRFELLEGRQGWATPHSKVLGRDSFKGMGVDFGDINGDGLTDIYVSNIADEYSLEESHFVWVNTGETGLMKKGVAPFVERSEQLGLARSGWGWDARLVDFDNDGTPEAIQATGFVRGNTDRWPELQEVAMSNDQLQGDLRIWPRIQPGDDLSGHGHNPFFVRAADGRYYDLAADLGLDQPQITRGIAVADVDGDGRLDFALANQWMTSYVYLNQSRQAGGFLGLNLLLPAADVRAGAKTTERAGLPGPDTRGYPAIGAHATLYLPDGRRMVAQVDGGSGHSGKRSPGLHFGLGKLSADTPLRVDLDWRDAQGQPHHESLRLTAGWHTVLLGS